MKIKFNSKKQITCTFDHGNVIKESSTNFEFSYENNNTNSSNFSMIKTLTTFESLISLFQLFKELIVLIFSKLLMFILFSIN
ncbi:hypothetical protein EB1_33800 [Empedobacter brevis NBRC 14943 = ATCC 43319]|uniref:Uncharacterized protein n=1 Tax=Empedobacter brevis NBRC 14943 = ATCC 43319 TaxID=1218108 RepID=A0A511NLB8_9FLAO|nr:hypothetical protein EB1_33800 [Empedobacter brevis NBRC 14943 = ATCC 43319]